MAMSVKPLEHDRAALCTAIYRAKRSYIVSKVRLMAGAEPLQSYAEDIAQTVFLRFDQVLVQGGFADLTLENWTEPNQHRRLQAWLFGASVLVVREFRRRGRKEALLEFDETNEKHNLAAVTLTPLQHLLCEEARQGCSPTELEILALQGRRFTSVEIADQMGLNPATVRSHLRTARRRMQLFLEAGHHADCSSGRR